MHECILQIAKHLCRIIEISVISTNEMLTVRKEIRRIREYFPEYSHICLLIQRK